MKRFWISPHAEFSTSIVYVSLKTVASYLEIGPHSISALNAFANNPNSNVGLFQNNVL